MKVSRLPIAGIGAKDKWPVELLTGQHDAVSGAEGRQQNGSGRDVFR